jgi:hypothetical protein
MLDGLASAVLAMAVSQTLLPATTPCFPSTATVGDFETRWLCGQLAAAGKGPLEGPTAYRLLYLPSFRPAKIVEVRQERSGWLIQTTILSGIGGWPPGDIRERRQRWLTADDVLDLHATVKRSGVWRADMRVNSNVVDDSRVVLEAVQPGAHRVHIVGASAMDGLPVHSLVELLRTMAGIDLEK